MGLAARPVRTPSLRSDIDHVSLVTATIADFLTLITDAPTAFAETGQNPPITLHSPEGAALRAERQLRMRSRTS